MVYRSVANQRIEGWWSLFRRSCTNWWMNYFKDLISQGHYDLSDTIQIECIRFAHAPILRAELNQIKLTWNSHRIRPSTNCEARIRLAGRPNVLYFAPDATISDYKTAIDHEDVEIVKQLCCNENVEDFICSPQFFELAIILMNENNLNMPTNASESFDLYKNLLRLIRAVV